jgi:hypothetical protein
VKHGHPLRHVSPPVSPGEEQCGNLPDAQVSTTRDPWFWHVFDEAYGGGLQGGLRRAEVQTVMWKRYVPGAFAVPIERLTDEPFPAVCGGSLITA